MEKIISKLRALFFGQSYKFWRNAERAIPHEEPLRDFF